MKKKFLPSNADSGNNTNEGLLRRINELEGKIREYENPEQGDYEPRYEGRYEPRPEARYEPRREEGYGPQYEDRYRRAPPTPTYAYPPSNLMPILDRMNRTAINLERLLNEMKAKGGEKDLTEVTEKIDNITAKMDGLISVLAEEFEALLGDEKKDKGKPAISDEQVKKLLISIGDIKKETEDIKNRLGSIEISEIDKMVEVLGKIGTRLEATIKSSGLTIPVEFPKAVEDMNKKFDSLNTLINKLDLKQDIDQLEGLSARIATGPVIDVGPALEKRFKDLSTSLEGITKAVKEAKPGIDAKAIQDLLEESKSVIGPGGTGSSKAVAEMNEKMDTIIDINKSLMSVLEKLNGDMEDIGSKVGKVSEAKASVDGAREKEGAAEGLKDEIRELKELISGMNQLKTGVEELKNAGEASGVPDMIRAAKVTEGNIKPPIEELNSINKGMATIFKVVDEIRGRLAEQKGGVDIGPVMKGLGELEVLINRNAEKIEKLEGRGTTAKTEGGAVDYGPVLDDIKRIMETSDVISSEVVGIMPALSKELKDREIALEDIKLIINEENNKIDKLLKDVAEDLENDRSQTEAVYNALSVVGKIDKELFEIKENTNGLLKKIEGMEQEEIDRLKATEEELKNFMRKQELLETINKTAETIRSHTDYLKLTADQRASKFELKYKEEADNLEAAFGRISEDLKALKSDISQKKIVPAGDMPATQRALERIADELGKKETPAGFVKVPKGIADEIQSRIIEVQEQVNAVQNVLMDRKLITGEDVAQRLENFEGELRSIGNNIKNLRKCVEGEQRELEDELKGVRYALEEVESNISAAESAKGD